MVTICEGVITTNDSYLGTSDDTPLKKVLVNTNMIDITSRITIKIIISREIYFRELQLGFYQKDVGAHSIQLIFPMTVFLLIVHLKYIMIIDRWSGDDLLICIQR